MVQDDYFIKNMENAIVRICDNLDYQYVFGEKEEKK